MCAGSAIWHVADVMLAKGKKVASALLEASEGDIQYRDGEFSVVGTDRKISLFETARRAKEIGENLDTKERRKRRSPSPTAAISPRWRSIRRPARSIW